MPSLIFLLHSSEGGGAPGGVPSQISPFGDHARYRRACRLPAAPPRPFPYCVGPRFLMRAGTSNPQGQPAPGRGPSYPRGEPRRSPSPGLARTRPEGPHLASPSDRLMTAPSIEQSARIIRENLGAGISAFWAGNVALTRSAPAAVIAREGGRSSTPTELGLLGPRLREDDSGKNGATALTSRKTPAS